MTYKAEFEPSGKRIILETETNILEAAQRAGINVESVCGGQGICKKCKVRVLSGSVSPTSEQEKKYLSDSELKKKYRLACCTTIRSDTRFYVSSQSLVRAQKIGLSGIEKKIRLDPLINKRIVYVDEPSLSDLRSDLSRVIHKYEEKYPEKSLLCDLSTIARLTSVLREGQWKITVAIYDEKEIISADAGDTTNRNFGIAVDLGTTTVAVYLVDLLSGETIDSLGAMNPQIVFGEDVMTRVSAILTDHNNDVKMHAAIINLLNQMIKDFCERNKTGKAEILEMVVVSNTVMHHIFSRLPVRQIALAPYVPAVSDPLNVKAKELGIEIAPGGYVYIAPVIAGFVGSDLLAMLIASGVDSLENNVIALDIGTNTEISLIANGKKVTTCSCAS
ncbi:MAG: 2Fe-2S iron-sulfur cluster binding domain-containing protein, partial [Deltaproteobacteria bacterium]|nr:2Fe-2S iron-sulfur cluster binding domain-containing protein [Deltaproteobacteria bacterium]